MEQKTAEEIIKEINKSKPRGVIKNIFTKYELIEAMQAYADQEVSNAIEKTLEMASEKAKFYPEYINVINKKSILSLKPEILKELEK